LRTRSSRRLVRQLALPDIDGVWGSLAIVAIEVTSLVVLLAGIAALIAEVQEKLHSSGRWRGEAK
jgi:hypothetical protein